MNDGPTMPSGDQPVALDDSTVRLTNHSRIHVLVVEDSPEDCEFYRRALTRHVNNEFEVTATHLGETGLEICQAIKPDCVLLDYNLPDLDGLEFLSRLGGSSDDHHNPAVLMLTGGGSENVARKALRGGAVDYLVKGEFSTPVLFDSIRNAVAAVTQQREQLEAQLRLQKRFQEEMVRRVKLEGDLESKRNQLQLAREIQRRLLPDSSPELPGFDVAGVCFPAEETGGDFFDYVELNDGSLGVLIGDVMEHGLGPALLAAEIRAYFKAFAKTNADLATILTHVNELLWADVDGSYFSTAFSLKVKRHSRRLSFAAAGHAGFVSHVDGTYTRIDAESPPLGITCEVPVEPCAEGYVMQPGEILVVFTDGIYESQANDGPAFGIARTMAAVHANRHLDCQDLVRNVIEESLRFSRFQQVDDMTIVALHCLAAERQQ